MDAFKYPFAADLFVHERSFLTLLFDQYRHASAADLLAGWESNGHHGALLRWFSVLIEQEPMKDDLCFMQFECVSHGADLSLALALASNPECCDLIA